MNSMKLEIRLLMEGLEIPLLFSSLFSILIISNAADTITKTHSIYSNNTIVSSGGSFEMGLFSPGNSRNQYLGIWHKKISVKTVVWIANREIPVVDSSGVLMIINPGILALVDGTSNIIWAANVTRSTQDTVAQLMDSGNLVVKDANDDNPEHFLWQSFDYPGDTLLPGMKLGKNFVTGLESKLSSWKSGDDPAKGEFTYWCDPGGYPQFILSSNSAKVYRTGPWNGIGFSTTRDLNSPFYTLELVFTMDEVHYSYETLTSSNFSRIVLSHDGIVQQLIWIDRTQQWVLYQTSPTDHCDTYNLCGVNGICNIGNSPPCSCLSKFVPQNETEWGNGDWYNGCVRRTPLDCHNGTKFLKYSGNKLPDTRIPGSTRSRPYGNYSQFGQDIYIRMASSELGNLMHNSKHCYTYKSQKEDLELPLFDLAVIANSTNNFSINNKLGEGGFGPVYKGILEEEEEIAVKRLSNNSSQGLDEFKNEVVCIAKLQHRNLVKLLGCCIQEEEKLLIYEYMPNKSLDYFIFDRTRSTLLDWPKRFNIINGISRGILYLHQDSRLRIIHRDLKASNILLDIDMNPKISDFGIARSFIGNETEANTNRVVGTYGYMSPEYVIEGLFLVKSDVFSFGVVVLETVSGKRNRGFNHPNHHLNLLGHAWILYKEGKATELIDAAIENSCNLHEVLCSIHLGLLCVQHRPEDRPNMSTVVLMLGGEGALTHQPKPPGFFTERNLLEEESSRSKNEPCSANMVTLTQLEPR
ncbi:hypothetical protein ACSBR1_011613 [Camellia fascicularis]